MLTYEEEKCYVDFYSDADTPITSKVETDDIYSIYVNGKKIIGGLFTREMLVFKALQPRPKGFTPPSSTRTI